MGTAQEERNMLTLYLRHKQTCPHRNEGRAYRSCRCPFWVDGDYEGVEVRQSLRVSTGNEAERELDKLKLRLKQPAAAPDGPRTITSAWDECADDARSRNLREPTRRRYKY